MEPQAWEAGRQYVFLAYRDEGQWQAMTANEREALDRACLADEDELRQSGRLAAVEDLQNSREAIRVQVVAGEVAFSDGSQAEGPLMRLFLIRARDLNEAIQVAARMPQVQWGPIDVRAMGEVMR